MKSSKQKRPVAIVTGGARRLGKKIVMALGEAGFDIVVNYNSSAKEARQVVRDLGKIGAKAISMKADISRRPEVERMMSKAMTTFKRVDLLVNSSAIFLDSPLEKTSDKNWNTTIDINLKGTFYCSQAVSKIMLKQKCGKIINIASLGGVQAWAGHLPYSVSKAGVIMLTKVLAKSLSPDIMVNAIAPGALEIFGEEVSAPRKMPKKRIPLQRHGKPSDITDMVVYLATKANYITGQVIIIDGGRSIQ